MADNKSKVVQKDDSNVKSVVEDKTKQPTTVDSTIKSAQGKPVSASVDSSNPKERKEQPTKTQEELKAEKEAAGEVARIKALHTGELKDPYQPTSEHISITADSVPDVEKATDASRQQPTDRQVKELKDNLRKDKNITI